MVRRKYSYASVTGHIDYYKTDKGMQISRENKVIFVHTPKTGGSTIEHSSLFDDARAHHTVGGHFTIGQMMDNMEQRNMSDFLRVGMIRHPCSRFISAFSYLEDQRGNKHDTQFFLQNVSRFGGLDGFLTSGALETTNVGRWAHFRRMEELLFFPNGSFGVDLVMCQEHWADGMARWQAALARRSGGEAKLPDALLGVGHAAASIAL